MSATDTEESPNNDTTNTSTLPRRFKKTLEKSADSEKAEAASEKVPPISGSRRPVTRSLSGRPIKRRIWEDNALDPSSYSGNEPDSQTVEHRLSTKKQKTSVQSRKTTRISTIAASKAPPPESSARSHEPSANSTDPQLISAHASPGSGNMKAAIAVPPTSSTSSTAASTPQPMPLPSSSSSAPPLVATRIGTARAMRATLPTPVPNLTKKSRGRRVPVRVVTTNGVEVIQDPPPVASASGTVTTGSITVNPDPANPKGKRSYVCSVEGCGKCFHRGEHLKRHIRSIHTHEKPFKCTYPDCDKNFNRHDNLLQHLKVHKQAQATAAMTASGGPVTLSPNGKVKAKSKSKGSAESAGAGSKARSKNGKGRRKKRRRSSSSEEDDEDGESEAESAGTASSGDEDDVDEASAVSNLLSLRSNTSGLKGTPTLVAPLHHTLSSYTHALTSMSSTTTLVGSVSGWGYPSSSSASFAPNGHSTTGSKPYLPFHTSFADLPPPKSYSSMFPHSAFANPTHHFSLSKAYSSGTTSYESSVAATANGAGRASEADPDGYHRHHGLGHVQNMVSDVRSANGMNDSSGQLEIFQSNMATSSLRSTNGLEGSNALERTDAPDSGKGSVGSVGQTSPLVPLSGSDSEGHEVRNEVRNLDPTLAATNIQSNHSHSTTSIPALNKSFQSPNDADVVNMSSTSSSTPVSFDKTNGFQNSDQIESPSTSVQHLKKNSDVHQNNHLTSIKSLETVESNETMRSTMLRPAEG